MYKIAVCDSNAKDGIRLVKLTKELLHKHEIHADIQQFFDPYSLLSACMQTTFHLFFLDIEHRISNGIMIAKQLRTMHCYGHIVFMSQHAHFMEQAYDLHAFQYLRKPIDAEKLEHTLQDHYAYLQPNDVLTIHKREQFYCIPYQDIVYIESDRVYLQIHTSSGDVRFRAKIKDLLDLLKHDSFIRCHQSFVINLTKVKHIERYQILTTDNMVIPISKTYTREVRSQFIKLYQETIL